ncbi:MAG TPA: class I SAM-dependent methyltransferase [Desulfobacterales bacterium]|nr:class I SAM-dependent methyltransferase [Desulfobacterales bacterium]
MSETLLIPLYFRALESRRSDPMVRDPLADTMVGRIDYDFSRFGPPDLTCTATLMRIREFDRLTSAFLEKHPGSCVVNIGCGLDTRFFRMDNGHVLWFDLDFPDVIAFRRQFLKETARCRFIPGSALDSAWCDALPADCGKRLLLLAEGVMPYLPEAGVRQLVATLTTRFPGARLVFDVVSPLQALLTHFNPVLMATKARFRWGLARGARVERWARGVRLEHEIFYFDQPEPRLGWYNCLRLFPHIARGFSILQLKLGPPKIP